MLKKMEEKLLDNSMENVMFWELGKVSEKSFVDVAIWELLMDVL